MRKTGMRLLAVLLAVVMVLPSVLIPGMAAEATGFTDVPEGSWYADAVNYVSEKGYMTGVGDNKFAPNDEVTRAMFVTILARITMAETDGTVSAFTDVPENKWYTGAVSWAAENGIVNGVGDGMFAPGKSITRQDLCTILYRFVNAMDYELTVGEEKTFTDSASVSSYAAEAVRYASSVGLIAGYDDGTFRPKATATRAQMAVIIMRLARLLDGQIVKPEPMPAQSFNGAAGDDMTVSVNAPKGALPENTNMTVSRVTDEAALAAIAEKADLEIVAAADITFKKDGAKLEPEKAVEVQISLDGMENLQNPFIIHMRDDGEIEYLNADVVSVNRSGSEKALRFYAKDFSVYAVGEGGTTQTNLLTVEFYDQNGEIINKQAIRMVRIPEKDNPVFDPGVPTITEKQSFEGWSDKQNYTEEDTGLSVAEINAHIKANYNADSAPATLRYYAMVFDVFYVIYHDQAGAVLKTEAVHKELNATSVSANIHMTYVPFKNTQNFAGWTPDIDEPGDEPTYQQNPTKIQDPSTYTFTISEGKNEVRLYPYLNSGHWLSFDNYISQDEDSTSGSYTAPVFIPTGDTTTAPDTPTRSGYTFGGWYTDKSFDTEYSFNSQLTKDTKVFAKWIPDETSYMVVYMIQNATDANDTNVDNNTYSYYDSVRRDWKGTPSTKVKTGEKVTAYTAGSGVNDKYLSTGDLTGTGYPKTIDALGQYFKYSDKNNSVSTVVKGDGTSILYVYYDRMEMTIRLHYGTSGLYSSVSNSISYYDAHTKYFRYDNSTGKYVPLTLTSTDPSYPDSDGDIKYTAARFTDPDGNVYYDGDTTFYTFNNSTTSTATQQTLTGLYGSAVPTTVWPDYDYTVFHWGYRTTSADSFNSFTSPIRTFTKSGTYGSAYEEDLYLCCENTPITEKPIYGITQNPETGEWGTSYFESSCDDSYNRLMPAKRVGTKLIGYNVTRDSMTSGYVSYSGPYGDTDAIKFTIKGSSGYINISGSAAYVYYQLNTHNLIYNSLGSTVRTETLRYAQSFAKYEYTLNSDGTPTETKYIPTNASDAYEFQGWYYDEGFTQPVDFSDKTMPDEPVNIYAKWMMKRFRIVLDPTGGDPTVQAKDVVFPGGTQATTFRVDYGELVAGGSINNAHRKGYTLLGWYLDPEYTIPFNFNQPITDAVADMTYRTATGDARKGSDPWTLENGQPKTYDDNGKPEVVGKVTIYAKWREDPKGTIGANVVYDAMDGKFSNNEKTWEDPYIYADNAEAFAQPASTPNNTELQFLYWQIMKPTSETDSTLISTGKKAYPGQIWDVLVADAVKTTAAVSGSVANPTRGVPARAATEYWEETDTIVPGEEYLIGVVNDGKVYLIVNYSPLGNHYYVQDGPNYDSKYDDYNSYLEGYTALAVIDSEGHVTGINDTTASDLSNCTWTFSSATGGQIRSTADSSRYLYGNMTVEDYSSGWNTYDNYIRSCYPYTTATTWTWDAANSYLYASNTLSGTTFYVLPQYYSESGTNVVYGDIETALPTEGSVVHKLYHKVIIEEPTTCTIHFAPNGGTGTMEDQEVNPGERYQLPACSFTAPTGKKFAGWKSPTGVTRDAGDYVIINDDITFEAQWQYLPANPHTVTVTYVGPEGDTAFVTPAPQSDEVGEGQLYTIISPDVSGYTPDYDAVTGTMGTKNLAFTVTYTKDVATNYTVYLHAVYGRANKDAKTHITWFGNNDPTGQTSGNIVERDEGLEINEMMTIPTPNAIVNGTVNHSGAKDGTPETVELTYDDHVFLGWARLEAPTGEVNGHAEPALTEADLYLRWVTDATYTNGGYYEYKKDNGTWAKALGVAADEDQPYYDMYAVWSGYAYVFHSATGKMEAIPANTKSTVDLTKKVTHGYLYGGYYSEYGGTKNVTAETMRAVKNTALAKRSMSDEQRLVTVTGATTYDATTDKIELDGSSVRLWNKKDAYGKNLTGDALDAVNGTQMTPVAGEIYYLKEVPAAYLPNVALAIKDTKDDNGNLMDQISEVYLLSASDELLYNKLQYNMGGTNQKATVSAKFIVDYRDYQPDGTYIPRTREIKLDELNEGLDRKIGWIMSYRLTRDQLEGAGLQVKPNWVTLDGVTVNGTVVTYTLGRDDDGETLIRTVNNP